MQKERHTCSCCHKILIDTNGQFIALESGKLILRCSSCAQTQEHAEKKDILGWLVDPLGLQDFVKIKGGKYQLDNPDNVKGLGAVQLSDFQIGKYPVINSWYSEFVAGGGYKDQQYWTEEGWRWRTDEKISEPGYWHNQHWNCPNAPVVGVSLYEAEAFSQWLTISRNDGHTYRLPTEAEWQLAAGGKQQTIFPWGNEWDTNNCNTENKIGKTTAVGIYLAGSTPVDEERSDRILDMAGNVWEWTDSIHEKYKGNYIVRGGAWCSPRDFCRCAYRLCFYPGLRYYYFGFRCARTYEQEVIDV